MAADGKPDQLGGRMGSKLAAEALSMIGNCPGAETQERGDFLRRLAVSNFLQDFVLARRQYRKFRTCCPPPAGATRTCHW